MRSLRDKLAQNTIIINTWLSIPSPWIAEIVDSTGYDCITLDMQHGLIDYQSALSMIQVMTDSVPLIRVPWNEPAMMMRMLDAGAMGIICPMVNNTKEAEAFVNSCKYPPLGNRSYGPIRAGFQRNAYFVEANKLIVSIAQIETKEGYQNLEEILAIEGLDGIYIGTIDLSISLGIEDPGNLDNPALLSVVKEIVDKTKEHGKFVAMHTMDLNDIDIIESLELDIITPWNDSRAIIANGKETLEQVRDKVSH